MLPRELDSKSSINSTEGASMTDSMNDDVVLLGRDQEEENGGDAAMVDDVAMNEYPDGAETKASLYYPSKEEKARLQKNMDTFKVTRSDGKFMDATYSVPGYGTVQQIVGIRRVPILRAEHAFQTQSLHTYSTEQGDGADDCLQCRSGGELFLCDTCDNAFHSTCYNYEPGEDSPFRCEVCLGTRTVRELRVDYLTRTKKLKKIDDVTFFNDILPEDDITGLSWKPPTGEGAATVLKSKLGGGLHARMVYKKLDYPDHNTNNPSTPGTVYKKGSSVMGSNEKRGNAQTPTLRAKLNADKKTNADVERYRIEQGIGLWDVEDSFFRNASPEVLKMMDGPFAPVMPKPKYITQTQYLVKFAGFSFRRCVWIPRVVLMYFRALRARVARFHTKLDDSEALPDTLETGGEHGEIVLFPTEYFEAERFVMVDFLDGAPVRAQVQWRGLDFTDSTLEAYADIQDEQLLAKYIAEHTRTPLTSSMYRDAMSKYTAAQARKQSVVQGTTTVAVSRAALYEEMQRDKLICLAAINGDKVDLHPVVGEYPHSNGTEIVNVTRYPWETSLDATNLAIRRHKLRALPIEQKIIMELIYTMNIPNTRQLRFYQYDGQCWLLSNQLHGRNSILADEMGLGKTMQSVTFIQLQKEFLHNPRPALILAPLSTLPHWIREVELCTTLSGVVYNGALNSRRMLQNLVLFDHQKRVAKDVIITSYETFMTDIALFSRLQYSCIIVDEAHRLKNHTSKLYQLLFPLKTDSSLLLTGTPIQNNMQEMWSLLHFLDRRLFKSMDEFLKSYGNLQTSEQVQQLHQVLRPFLLRRTKANVEKALKPLKETVIEVELTPIQKRFYKAIYERNASLLLTLVKRKDQAPGLLNVAMQLRKCINHPFLLPSVEEAHLGDVLKNVRENRVKHPGQMDPNDKLYNLQTADYSTLSEAEKELRDKGDYLAEASGKQKLLDKLLTRLRTDGHKVLIFSQMTKMLDILAEYLNSRQFPYERIDGSVQASNRQLAIDRFSQENGNGFVFLLSTRAGGVGLNLTAADTVIIYDSDWNPQMDVQAQARAHRLGQEKDVRVFRLLGKNTYEMKMFDDASKKLGLDKAVLHTMSESTNALPDKNSNANIVDNDNSNYGLTGDLDLLTRSNEQDLKTEQLLDSKNIEKLLKEGLYGALIDNNQELEITEQSIDDILLGKGMARERTIDDNKESNAFSKASYGESGVDFEDPEFWSKMGLFQVQETRPEQYQGKRKRQSVNLKNQDLSRNGEKFEEADLVTSSEDEDDDEERESVESMMVKVQPRKRQATVKKPFFWTQGISPDMSKWDAEQTQYYNTQCQQVGYTLNESSWHPAVLQKLIDGLFLYGYLKAEEMVEYVYAELIKTPFLDPRIPEVVTLTSLHIAKIAEKGMTEAETNRVKKLAVIGYGFLDLSAISVRNLMLGVIKTLLHYACRTRANVAASIAAYNESMFTSVKEASEQWDGTIPFASILVNVWAFNPKAMLLGKSLVATWGASELFRNPNFLYDLRIPCDTYHVMKEEPPVLELDCPLQNAGSKTIRLGEDVYYPVFLHGLDVDTPLLTEYRQALNNPTEAPFGTFARLPSTGTICIKSPLPAKEMQPRSGPLIGTAFDAAYPFFLSSDTPSFGPVVRPYHGSNNSLTVVCLALTNPNLPVNMAIIKSEFLKVHYKNLIKSLQTSSSISRVLGNPVMSISPEPEKMSIPAYTPDTLATDFDHFPSCRPLFMNQPVIRKAEAPKPIVDATPLNNQTHPLLVYSAFMFPQLNEFELKRLSWWSVEQDRHLLVGMFYLGNDCFHPKLKEARVQLMQNHPDLCFHSIIQGRGYPRRSDSVQERLLSKFEKLQSIAQTQAQAEFAKLSNDASNPTAFNTEITPIVGIDEHNFPILPFSPDDTLFLSQFISKRIRNLSTFLQDELYRARNKVKQFHQVFHKNYLDNLKNLKSICHLLKNGVTKMEDLDQLSRSMTQDQYIDSRALNYDDLSPSNYDQNNNKQENRPSSNTMAHPVHQSKEPIASPMKIDVSRTTPVHKTNTVNDDILTLWKAAGLRGLNSEEFPLLKKSMTSLLSIPNYLIDATSMREIKIKEILKILSILANIADNSKLALETTHGLVRLPYAHIYTLVDALKRITRTLNVVYKVKDLISTDTLNVLDGLFAKIQVLTNSISKTAVVAQELGNIQHMDQLHTWPKTVGENDLLYMNTNAKNTFHVQFAELAQLYQ